MILGMLLGAPALYGADGGEVFMDKCGSCHGSGGEAPAFAPTKYASVQWQRFFERDKHARKKDISDKLSASEIAAVSAYLMQHAADSEQPEAAGLR